MPYSNISFDLLGIPGLSFGLLNSGSSTVVSFEANISPQLKIELLSLGFNISYACAFLTPVKLISGSWVKQLDGSGNPLPVSIAVTGVNVSYDSKNNIDIDLSPSGAGISIDSVEIANSNLILNVHDVIPYFSENVPRQVGMPLGFKGVYIQDATIFLPPGFNQNTSTSTAEIKAKNLLIGTGGVTGTIGLAAIGGSTSPAIHANLGGFNIIFKSFDVSIAQNSFTGSNVSGTLSLPGFQDDSGNPALINIDVHIDTHGFNITASSVQSLVYIQVPGAFTLTINSLSVGELNGRFFLSVSGKMNVIARPAGLTLFPDTIDIQKMIIWDDGKFEFHGGGISLPKSISISAGPVNFSVTNIHLGTHEQNGRQYAYFGFDGGVNLDPSGVDVRGKGIKLYFTHDGGTPDVFLKIDGISLNLIIPGDVDPSAAALILQGFLSIGQVQNGAHMDDEYTGSVSFKIPSINMSGGAGMRLNPKDPSFLINAAVDLANPILLGDTGLGIYGFSGVFGRKYIPSKSTVLLTEADPWWQYYKIKQPKEGVTPQIKKTLAITADPALSIAPGIQFLIHDYLPSIGITKVKVFRAYNATDALSIRTMTLAATINAPFGTTIMDSFSGLTYPPFGDTLYYRLAAVRTIINEDGNAEDISSLPSEILTTTVADVTNPLAPVITSSYTNNLPTSLNSVVLPWPQTCYNGTYYVYMMNSQGNWVLLYQVNSKNASFQFPPNSAGTSSPDFTTYPMMASLAKQDSNGNTLYYRFKIDVQNASGLLNLYDYAITI